MDDLADLYLGHTTIKYKEVTGTGKSQVTFDQVPLDTALDYAAEDADITLRLHQALKPRLLEEHLTTAYETLERPLIPVLAAMEQKGIKVDMAQLKQVSQEFSQRLLTTWNKRFIGWQEKPSTWVRPNNWAKSSLTISKWKAGKKAKPEATLPEQMS